MENGDDEIGDDIFEQNMHEIDERETPRWEMSEEEPDEVKEQARLLNCKDLPKQQVKQNSKKATEVVQNGHKWDDDAEKDSVKDFTVHYREQEEKYMERTDEAIVIRAAEEHIRQPIPYDDVDSVKNFVSEGISRIPSEEQLCLSPPWPLGYPEDDGIALEVDKIADVAQNETNGFHVDNMISQAKLRADARIGTTAWQEEDAMDFTRNYAEEGSLELSCRPSSEDISLTPPWLDTDKESSCKDGEEQVLDDGELPSDDPPTTTSTLTSTPTTTHSQAPLKPDLIPSVTSQPLTDPTQSLRPIESGNSGKPEHRRTLQASSSGRNSVVNSATRPPQIRAYGDLYNNARYPSPRYTGSDTYYDSSNMATMSSYPVNSPYGNRLPNTRMSYTGSRSAGEFVQQPSIKSFNGVQSFNPRQFRPRPQGNPTRSQINPNNPSYSNISRPYPGGYYGPRAQHGVRAPPRLPINGYDPPYYSGQTGNWQYQVRQPQISIQHQPPLQNADDFAEDEVINFAPGAQRLPDRSRGGPVPDIHRKIPPSEHQSPRGYPAPEVLSVAGGVPDFHPDARRDLSTSDSRRGMSHDHQRVIAGHQLDFPANIPDTSVYSDFPDDITTVSESDVSPVMSTCSGSQSSLAVYCSTPHRDGIETASVMSFTSEGSTHQDLDSQVDQIRNLLAVINTKDARETAQTLYSLSTSKEHCQAMRLSGCLPLLIELQHKSKLRDPRVGHEVRVRSAQAMRNIIAAGLEDKRGKRERRVLKLIEIVRSYSIEVRYLRNVPSSSKLRVLDTALAAIMKFSFEEEHRAAIGDLGGVEAIGELLELSCLNKDHSLSPNVRKYSSMTLTNMTFEKTRSKALLGNSQGIVKALLKNLSVYDDERLIQVSASVIRNLSCKSDERSKLVLQECNAVATLMTAAQKVSGESTLRPILYAVWNLSAHSSENKVQICESHKALGFLVEMLAYKSPSNSLSVVESSGGILRNLSSQIAVKPEYRTILRDHECFKMLLANLRSPSLRVIGNACGILWNLSARCEQDQEILLKMGAMALLKPFVSSKNKSISKGAGAAIKNLQNYKTLNPARNSPSQTRKQNGILRQENGSPSTPRTKGRSRDAHSLNSFTGSADDVKETGRQSSRTKEIGETDSGYRTKGVRWSDDKRKDRKVSSNDRKQSDSSLDDQAGATSRDQATKDFINDLTSSVGQLRVGEKSRSKKLEGSYSSPRTKKKSTSKTKKHSGGDDAIDDSLRLSQESQLNRCTSARQSSANGRRNTSSDIQLVEMPAKHSAKTTKGKDGRKGTSGRDDGLEVARSGDECSRSSPISGRHSVRTTRFDSEENDRDLNDEKGARDSQRCQCPDDAEVWIKRNKVCSHCQKRRISHSSDSTSGSRRSSYESLSSSNRQLNRKEPLANGTGYVTTI